MTPGREGVSDQLSSQNLGHRQGDLIVRRRPSRLSSVTEKPSQLLSPKRRILRSRMCAHLQVRPCLG
jgi:hypothetical protein